MKKIRRIIKAISRFFYTSRDVYLEQKYDELVTMEKFITSNLSQYPGYDKTYEYNIYNLKINILKLKIKTWEK